jgi:hypothetical protein
MGFNPDSKAEQRRELERLMANYDGSIIRSKADQQLQVVCPQCRGAADAIELGVCAFEQNRASTRGGQNDLPQSHSR